MVSGGGRPLQPIGAGQRSGTFVPVIELSTQQAEVLALRGKIYGILKCLLNEG